jgi:septal ring factor EnvC (AmiA/AmiB activator)
VAHAFATVETPYAIYDALSAIDVPPEKVRTVVQSLEHDMALFATRSQFDQLDQFSGSRFELLRAEIKAFSARLEETDRRFGQIDRRFEQVEKRFDQVDQRIQQVGVQFNQRFDAFEKQIASQVAAAQAQVENRLTTRLGAMLIGAVAIFAGLTQVVARIWPASG